VWAFCTLVVTMYSFLTVFKRPHRLLVSSRLSQIKAALESNAARIAGMKGFQVRHFEALGLQEYRTNQALRYILDTRLKYQFNIRAEMRVRRQSCALGDAQ